MDNDIQNATLVNNEENTESRSKIDNKRNKTYRISDNENKPEIEADKKSFNGSGEKVIRAGIIKSPREDKMEPSEKKGKKEFESAKNLEGAEKTEPTKTKKPNEKPQKEKDFQEKNIKNKTVNPFEDKKVLSIAVILIIILSAFSVVIYLNTKEESDVVVNVPKLRIGDNARYGISGNVRIKDAENEPIQGEIESGYIDLDDSTMNVKVEGTETVTDGFYNNYTALKTSTSISWKIGGWVETKSYNKADVNGHSDLDEIAYRNGDVVLVSDTEANSELIATINPGNPASYDKEYDSQDHLVTYSSESGKLQHDFDDVIHKADLKKGDSGTVNSQGTTFKWKAVGNKEEFGTDCVIVKFSAEKPPEHIKSQTLELYLSSKHPFPVRTDLDITTTIQGTVTVKYSMKMNYFKRGGTQFEMPEDNILQESRYSEFSSMEKYPAHGVPENSSINDLPINTAHEKALNNSELSSYIDNNPQAYLVQGIYNESKGPVWNLTYSVPDSENGYAVVVKESEVEDRGELALEDMGNRLDPKSLAPENSITWAGAEQILKQNEMVKENAFSNGKPELGKCNFGVRTGLYQPSLDLVSMFSSAEPVDYGYTLTKNDEFATGVNAETGQLMFTGTHSGVKLF